MQDTKIHFTDTKNIPGVQRENLAILNDLEALQRDPATAELIRTGRTMGCFYIESPSMRSLFQRMHCTCYEDVVAASSIIRPGVAESGMMKAYVERFRAAREKTTADCGLRIAQSESANSFKFQVSGFKEQEAGQVANPSRSDSQSAIHNSKFKIQNSPSQIYIHPKLVEVLADTYGVMVYQEDVLKVVHELAGMSLGEADVLRRAMSGKAGSREAMESVTARFFAGCRARGVPEPVVVELWRQIETFARFSFCKGHSAAFAVLSYQVAYLKAHHPAEFMAAVLSNGGGYYGAAAYVQECRRMGLRVLGPDVNESEINYIGKSEARGERQENCGLPIADCGMNEEKQFQVSCFKFQGANNAVSEQPASSGNLQPATQRASLAAPNSKFKIQHSKFLLPHSGLSTQDSALLHPSSSILHASGWVRVGFAAIKNFPLELARRIVSLRRERPFDGFADFLRRVKPGYEAVEKLIRVGAFDRFGIPREHLFLELDISFRERTADEGILDFGFWISDCGLNRKGREIGKNNPRSETVNPTFTIHHSTFASSIPQSAIRNPQLEQRVADEIELLGYGVSAHPLELLPDEVWRGTVAARDLRRHVGRRVTMIGWLIASKLVRTHQSREFMKFLSLEDLTDTFEVTLFPRAYRRFAPLTLGVGPFRIRGKVEDDLGALNLVVDHLEILTERLEEKDRRKK